MPTRMTQKQIELEEAKNRGRLEELAKMARRDEIFIRVVVFGMILSILIAISVIK